MELHVGLVGRKDLSGEIYRQIRRAILDARLRPNDALPPSRELARTLGVSRMTVTVAYERLASEGFVRSRVGSGTFVSERAAPRSAAASVGRTSGALRPRPLWQAVPLPSAFARPARFDFRSGIPDVALFPHVAWGRIVSRYLRSGSADAGKYGDPAGHRGLREAIAWHIGIARGVAASADDVTVTSGTQQAIDIVGRVLIAPGDQVVVEDPGYTPPRFLFASLGARLTGVPVDRDGLVVDALPRSARLAYITPSHQFPLGVPLALDRRHRLLAWAEQKNAAIIEDDYDSEFRFEGRPIEPLKTLDTTGRVVYLGSFSKTMLPSLRLGFIVTPPALRDAVRRAKFLTDWCSPTATQGALALFISEGGFARHIRRAGSVYRERRALVLDVLRREFAEHLELVPSVAGLHIAALARSASVERIDEIRRRASNSGVEVQALSTFAVGARKSAGIILGYGGIATADIEAGLHLLRRCFDH